MDKKDLILMEDRLKTIYVNKNILFFDGNIDSDTIFKAMSLIQKNPKVDRIHLTTYGGSVEQGLKFISFIRSLGRNIDIKVVGYCMSIGTAILSAATGKKIMGKYSFLMYHDISSHPWDTTTSGLRNIVKNHEFLDTITYSLINPTNDKKIKNFLDMVYNSGKDINVNSTEALDIGLVDVLED